MSEESKISKYEHYNILYGYYSLLFTEKQKNYFENFYFYDLSLSEIAQNNHISRAAVFDAIDKIHKTLDEYEDKLMLYQKDLEREKVYEEFSQIISDKENYNELVKRLREIE